MPDTQFDVILVGGGVMGCATAYYLLKADPNLSIAVVEMDSSYRRSSTILSDGNTRLQFNLKENILMSLYGLEVLERFADEMAVGEQRPEVSFRQQGNLFLTDGSNLDDVQQGLALQKSLGCTVEWLPAEQVSARFPLYNPENIAGGTFGPLDGTMDPQAVLMGYRRRAVALGTQVIEGKVEAVITAGGKVTGVQLASGEALQSPMVVNCAGAWATELAASVGIDLPVSPVKRQVHIFETQVQPDRTYPLTVFPSGGYLIHEHGNRFISGKSSPDDPVGIDFSTDRKNFVEVVWPELVDYVPAFEHIKWTRSWAGLYAVNTFDGNAILGEWPGLGGFYLANGFSGHGFQQCHAVGRYLSELILDLPPQLDLSIFSPARLLEGQPVYEGHGKMV